MKNPLPRVYSVSFVFALSAALASYVNSTFLGTIVGAHMASALFAIGAVLSLIVLELVPFLEKKIGNARIILLTFFGLLIALSGLRLSDSPCIISLSFILYVMANNVGIIALDIFVEHFSKDTATGKTRGLYLTTTNLAWMLSPFAAGVIIASFGYHGIYLFASFAVLLALMLSILFLRKFKDSVYTHLPILTSWRKIRTHRDLRRIVSINFLLQFFFASMVIFSAPYLHTVMGYDWKSIGLIFTIMLAPFVLLQYPLGKLSDTRGEKKLLESSFLLIGLATAGFALITSHSIALFALALFLTRVGAATVQVMADTYFFKCISDSEPGVISIYRAMHPLAYVIAPAFGILMLSFVSYQTYFMLIAIIVGYGTFVAGRLTDR